MFRKMLTLFFFLGLLASAGAWAASYWNWEYTLRMHAIHLTPNILIVVRVVAAARCKSTKQNEGDAHS
jgi:membrane protein implicated in regulation of membrane protease activity